MGTAGASKKLPIIWEGSVVGWMENPSVENWFHFGKWIPAETDDTDRFLQTIEVTGEALVLLGEQKGRVHGLPDRGEIDVKIWPGMEW
jgi:hypothetical protein